VSADQYGSADALFEAALKEWGGVESFMLPDGAPLPDAEVIWWKLHPREVEMFGIKPSLHPRLVEAYSWYVGAVLGRDHNDYHAFHESERTRWARHVVIRDGEPVFDHGACERFMHEAAALPLRQCAALLQKFAAAELRGALAVYGDEDPS
jgi:hypothetical protein